MESEILALPGQAEKTSMINKTKRVGLFIAGIIVFGGLMGLRHELSSVWARARRWPGWPLRFLMGDWPF